MDHGSRIELNQMYRLFQIEVYAAGQYKICAKFSIGHLAVSYPPKHQAPRSSLHVSRLSVKVADIFATFSIQFIQSKISSSDDSILRRFRCNIMLLYMSNVLLSTISLIKSFVYERNQDSRFNKQTEVSRVMHIDYLILDFR